MDKMIKAMPEGDAKMKMGTMMSKMQEESKMMMNEKDPMKMKKMMDDHKMMMDKMDGMMHGKM